MLLREWMSLSLLLSAVALVVPLASAQDTVWVPPEPTPESFDWIRLTSGEWLKGEIKGKRDEVFEFDSEELDLLQLDWEDIAELRSPKVRTYVFEDDIVLPGPAAMKDGVIRVGVGEEVREMKAALLLSIIEGKPTEWSYWSARASLGLVGRVGNTEQTDINALLNIRRDSPKTQLDLGYAGNFGEVDGQENTNNHRATSSFNVFLYRNLFLNPIAVQVYADKFQNISLQFTLAAGVGYYIVRNPSVEWKATLGGGYLRTDFVSVEPGQDDSESSGAAILVSGFEWDITGDIEWSIDYNGQIGIPDLKQSVHHLTTLFSIEVWDALDFTISANLDRVENPKPNAEGVTPVPNDIRVAFGLGVDL